MFDEMTLKMEGVIELIRNDLNGIKTGRAKPSMIESIKIEAYEGTTLPLVEVASISAPDPHMLVVQPWDQSVISSVEKGLAASEMKLNPVVDGNIIRINIPPLTEERRLEMVKLVNQKIESGKDMVRGIRNDMKRDIDGRKKEAGVSEDDIRGWVDELQEIYDKYMKKLDEIGEAKEKELMEI